MRILIVGAGIGGLTAALALLRDGHEVAVYEQAPQLAELGAGVQISANGSRVLFALGLEAALRRVWSVPAAKEIRLWNTGETWKLFDLGAESVARVSARLRLGTMFIRACYTTGVVKCVRVGLLRHRRRVFCQCVWRRQDLAQQEHHPNRPSTSRRGQRCLRSCFRTAAVCDLAAR